MINHYSSTSKDVESSVIRSSLEGSVKFVRECCFDCANAVKDKKKPVDEFIAKGIDHSQC